MVGFALHNIFNQKFINSKYMQRASKTQAKAHQHGEHALIQSSTNNGRVVNHNTKIKDKDQYSKKFFQRRLALQMQVRQKVLKKIQSKNPIKKSKNDTQKNRRKKPDIQQNYTLLQKNMQQKQYKFIGQSSDKYQENYHNNLKRDNNFNGKFRKEESTTKYTKQAVRYEKDNKQKQMVNKFQLNLGQLMDKNKVQSRFCKMLSISNRPLIQYRQNPYLDVMYKLQNKKKQNDNHSQQSQMYQDRSQYIGQSSINIDDYIQDKKYRHKNRNNPECQYYDQSQSSILFNNSCKMNSSHQEEYRNIGKLIKVNKKEQKNILTSPIICKLGNSGNTMQKSQQQKARSNGFKCQIDQSLRARLADIIMKQRQKCKIKNKQLNTTPISNDYLKLDKPEQIITNKIHRYKQNSIVPEDQPRQMLSQSLYSKSITISFPSIQSPKISKKLPQKQPLQYDYEQNSRRLHQYLYQNQLQIQPPMISRKLHDRHNGFANHQTIYNTRFGNSQSQPSYNQTQQQQSQQQHKPYRLDQHIKQQIIKHPHVRANQQQNPPKYEQIHHEHRIFLTNNQLQVEIKQKKMFITPANQNQLKKQLMQQQQHNMSEKQSEHSQIICAICQTSILHRLWPYATFYNRNVQQPQYYNFYEMFQPQDQPIQNQQNNPSQMPILLHCGHPYHRICIEEWFKYKAVCPLCKTEHQGGNQEHQQYLVNQMSHQLTFISDSGDDQNEDFVYFHQNRHNYYINHNEQQQHQVIQLQEMDVNNIINSRLAHTYTHTQNLIPRNNNFMTSINNYTGVRQNINSSNNNRGNIYNIAINRQFSNIDIQSQSQHSQISLQRQRNQRLESRRNVGRISRNIIQRHRQRQRQNTSQQQFKMIQSQDQQNNDGQQIQLSQSFIKEQQSSWGGHSEYDN